MASRSFSLYFLNIWNKNEAKTVQIESVVIVVSGNGESEFFPASLSFAK